MKTRIRRLYDIANILQSLHLIQKVQITESHGARKPAFEYIGPNVKGLGKNSLSIITAIFYFDNVICSYEWYMINIH